MRRQVRFRGHSDRALLQYRPHPSPSSHLGPPVSGGLHRLTRLPDTFPSAGDGPEWSPGRPILPGGRHGQDATGPEDSGAGCPGPSSTTFARHNGISSGPSRRRGPGGRRGRPPTRARKINERIDPSLKGVVGHMGTVVSGRVRGVGGRGCLCRGESGGWGGGGILCRDGSVVSGFVSGRVRGGDDGGCCVGPGPGWGTWPRGYCVGPGPGYGRRGAIWGDRGCRGVGRHEGAPTTTGVRGTR